MRKFFLISLVILLSCEDTSDPVVDCNGTSDGSAYTNDCGCCVGGSTGLTDASMLDCAGDCTMCCDRECDANAVPDECQNCGWNNQNCSALDTDSDGIIDSEGDCIEWECDCRDAEEYLNCEGTCINDSDGDLVCDEFEITGCIDTNACNFNENATEEDESCIYTDGICESCSGDIDGTGEIVDNDDDEDQICDADEIAGCQDDTACNYNENATDEGSCTYVDGICETCSGETDGLGSIVDNDQDNDNVCDDEDPCVGEWDECGVCNGDGEVYHCRDLDGDGIGTDGPDGTWDQYMCEDNDDYWITDCDIEDLDDTIFCELNEMDCLNILCGNATIDSCGVCDGDGEIYQCGCNDIPEGYCDCDGNVIDECDVCNGPGEIYECGCFNIPQGDCDCYGNTLTEYYSDWNFDGTGDCDDSYLRCPTDEIENWLVDNCDGYCEGDLTDACSLLENEIYITPNGDIWYNINEPIFAFQLEFQSINITEVSNGDATEYGFQLEFSNDDSEFNDYSTVVGYDLSGGNIPLGCGTLFNMTYTGALSEIQTILFSDENGNSITVTNHICE